jgi:translation initiation factor IF-2
VQPQTLEAIKVAKENRNVIVVALSKVDKFPSLIDRSNARSRVLAELSQHDVLSEDFGGDVQVVEVSGRSGEGIDSLVEALVVQADIMDIRASFKGQAEAVVLDAHLERGRGIVAELLVKWGSLSVGDTIVVGATYGKVKNMYDDKGGFSYHSLNNAGD